MSIPCEKCGLSHDKSDLIYNREEDILLCGVCNELPRDPQTLEVSPSKSSDWLCDGNGPHLYHVAGTVKGNIEFVTINEIEQHKNREGFIGFDFCPMCGCALH